MQNGKYSVETVDQGAYGTTLSLNLTLTEQMDFGTYFCISKNQKGLTKARVTVFGKFSEIRG